jgi:hypothetical protein
MGRHGMAYGLPLAPLFVGKVKLVGGVRGLVEEAYGLVGDN